MRCQLVPSVVVLIVPAHTLPVVVVVDVVVVVGE